MKIGTSDAAQIAQDAISQTWEEVKYGREHAEDANAFWMLASARLYKIAKAYRIGMSKHISLDEAMPSGDDWKSASGKYGHTPAHQIDEVYLKEVRAGIERLPVKWAEVMRLLAAGENALDIAAKLRIPVNRVFQHIASARKAMFIDDLIGMQHDK